MKKLIYTLLSTALLGAVGCSKDETSEPQLESTLVTLNVDFAETDVAPKAGDKLSIYVKDSYKLVDLSYKDVSNDGYIFESTTMQNVVSGDDYVVQYPASESPTYKSSIGNISATQTGNKTNEHLLSMGRFEADITYPTDGVVTLDNRLSVVSLTLEAPSTDYVAADAGDPVKVDIRVEDELDGAYSYSTSTLYIKDVSWDGDVIANISTMAKELGVTRTIKVRVTTALNKNYVQTLTQDDNVEYESGAESTITADALEYDEPNFDAATQTFTITSDVEQDIRIGLDAERLWYWRDNLRDELAQLSVGDINVEFARVAIDGAYELNEGEKHPEAYDIQLNMMRAFKAKRPDIKFFATPRPIFNSYTTVELVEFFGHVDNCPWSSIPMWAYEWKINGTKTMPDGTVVPNYVEVGYNKEKTTKYFADYLNFMHANGFDFEYMDLTNETETRALPQHYRDLYDGLREPGVLDEGVQIPTLIAPSSWSVLGGIEWMAGVTTPELKEAFGVAAVHNTGLRSTDVFGDMKKFVTQATGMGKEAWNTELHDWVGIDTETEVLTSNFFFDYFRAGYAGMSGWLFFGPANGTDHPKLWVGSTAGSHTKSAKYEIFKEVVNNANGGNYLESTGTPNNMSDGEFTTTVFVKDNRLTIATLNKSTDGHVTNYDLGEKAINGAMNVRKWSGDLPKSGLSDTVYPTTAGKFQFYIEPQTLYIFTMDLTEQIVE